MKKIHKLLLSSTIIVLLLTLVMSASFKRNSICTYTIVNPELQTYYNKIVSAGGTMNDYDKACYDTLVTNLKQKNVWYKLIELAPFEGGYSSSLIKLKYKNYDTISNHNFISSDYDTLTGFHGNASTKWMDTNYDLSTTEIRAICYGFYSHDDNNKGIPISSGNATTSTYMCNATTEGGIALCYASPQTLETGVRKGLISLSSDFEGVTSYINDVARFSKNSATTTGNLSGNMTLFRYGTTNYFNGKVSMYYVAQPLSSVDIKNLSNEIERLYTNIGRRSNNRFAVVSHSVGFGTGATTKVNRWSTILADSMNMEEVNCSISGTLLQYNTAVGTSGRVRFIQEILSQKPKKVFIDFAINDLRYNTATISNYCTQLRYIVSYLKKSGIDSNSIYLCTPTYMNPAIYTAAAPWNGGSVAIHVQYKDSVVAIASSLNVKSLDGYTWMLNNGANTLIAADKIHPNNAGHLSIANYYFVNL